MDPYVYPNTTVLRNLRDIRDPDGLARFEMDMASSRIAELSMSPLQGGFNTRHLQAIHRSAEVLALANPAAEFVYAGQGPGQQEPVQAEIFRPLIEFAQAGKHVVRPTSGEPLVFGRGA